MQLNASPEETQRAREHPTKQINERRRMAFLDKKIARMQEQLTKARKPEDIDKLNRKLRRAERERRDLKLYLL